MITPKNLLLVRTDRIGDVVLSLPLAEVIKKKYPDCKISFLLREYTRALASFNPFVDEILIFNPDENHKSQQKILSEIQSNKFDAAVVINPTFQVARLIKKAKIKNRIGSGYRWFSFLFNHKIYQHRKYGTRHELDLNIDMLQKIGIQTQLKKGDVNFHLGYSSAAKVRVNQLITAELNSKQKKYIVVHAGSGGSAVDLPIVKMKLLVELLLQKLNFEIILTGSELEKKLCENFIISERVHNFAGKFNLEEMIVIIEGSELFISNSTGPLHIAAALGKKIVSFFPKIPACSFVRWGPYSNESLIFTPSLSCDNCNREQCERLDCMNSIDPRLAVENIFMILEKKEYRSV